MKLKLTYLDTATQKSKELVVKTPVAIGCDFGVLPAEIDRQAVSHVLVSDASINSYHALIAERQGRIVVTDVYNNCPVGISKNRFTIGEVKFDFEIVDEVSESELLSNSANKCQKMVGFLFKRPCDRISSIDCPHCNSDGNDLDDYESDYVYYENYGNYHDWGYTYYRDRHYYHYDCDNRRVEFTEADNVAFEEEGDRDFERDYSAS